MKLICFASLLDVFNYYVIAQKDLFSSALPKITPITFKTKKPFCLRMGQTVDNSILI
ncbi:hypothetical protein PSKAS_23710 [Peribacillus sp. N1]